MPPLLHPTRPAGWSNTSTTIPTTSAIPTTTAPNALVLPLHHHRAPILFSQQQQQQPQQPQQIPSSPSSPFDPSSSSPSSSSSPVPSPPWFTQPWALTLQWFLAVYSLGSAVVLARRAYLYIVERRRRGRSRSRSRSTAAATGEEGQRRSSTARRTRRVGRLRRGSREGGRGLVGGRGSRESVGADGSGGIWEGEDGGEEDRGWESEVRQIYEAHWRIGDAT